MRRMQPSERKPLVIPGQNSNTPAGSAVTVEQHPSWLTQEMWEGLSSKKIPLDTLKPEQQAEFSDFLGKLTSGEATAPGAAPAPGPTPAPTPAATPEPAPAATPAATPSPAPSAAPGEIRSPSDVPLADPAKREEFFRKYNTKAAEANTQRQIAENLRAQKTDLERKLAELQKRPVTAPNPDDPLAAESVKSQAETIKKLEDTLALVMDHLTKQQGALESYHAQGAAQSGEQAALLGLERFQYETQNSDLIPPELGLQTTVPLPLLNAELTRFAAAVGGLENVNRYLKEPAFKAQVEAAGHKLSEGFIKNLDKFNLIHELNEEVQAGKYPDPMAAYSHHLLTSGKLATALRDSKLAGASAVANGVASNNNATPTLTPGQNATPPAVGWTRKSALEWVRAHPDIKPGSADDATFQEITRLMDAQQLR